MRRLLALLLFGFLSLSFSLANQPTEAPRTPMAPYSPLEMALLRVAQLTPAVASADVFLLMDGHEDVMLSAAYGEVGHYVELPEGQYQVVVSDRESAMRLFEGTIRVSAGFSHTLVLTSMSEADAPGAAGYALKLLEDHFPLFPVDTAGLRVVHAAAGLGAIDVFVAGERVFANAEPLEARAYEAFAAGEVSVELRLAGVETSLGAYVLPLEAGSFHTLSIYGEGGSELLLSNERPVARAD
jgi:hypothetical protein